MIIITITQLRQYRKIISSIRLLECELEELILQSKAPDSSGRSSSVSDSVAQIVLNREKTQKKINSLLERKNAVESYLEGCNRYYGTLLRMHYVDGRTWASVALSVGGGNTEDSVRKACHRYVERNP